MPYRASFRHDNGPRSPRASWYDACLVSLKELRTSSEVTEARSDPLCLISGALKPGASAGTTNPRMPSSVFAHTTATSAIEPLVIHIFRPDSTQSVPSRRAEVRIAAGSDPASGSVSPKQPIASPVAILGSQASLCPSDPHRQMANIASEPCTDTSDR